MTTSMTTSNTSPAAAAVISANNSATGTTAPASAAFVKQYAVCPGFKVAISFDKERVAKHCALLAYNFVLFVLNQIETAARVVYSKGQAARPVVDSYVAEQFGKVSSIATALATAAARRAISSASSVYAKAVDVAEKGVQTVFEYFVSVSKDIKVSLSAARKA